MSDVEEAPASEVVAPAGDGLVVKLHGIERMVVVRKAGDMPVGRRLFEGLEGGEGDDLDAALGAKGKLPWKWADLLSEQGGDIDDMDLGSDDKTEDGLNGVGNQAGGGCGGGCFSRIAALEEAIGRVERMVKMLVAANGLVCPQERLRVEKHKGRMARG